jgi:hypothetical protein
VIPRRPRGWWLWLLGWVAVIAIYGAIVVLVVVMPVLDMVRVFSPGG